MVFDKEKARSDEWEPTRDGFAVSRCSDALVFSISNPEAVRNVFLHALHEGPTSGALETVVQYVARFRDEGAELTPLYPERAQDVLPHGSPASLETLGWQIAVPDLSPGRELSSWHYLQLASPDHGNQLLELLQSDDRIAAVHHPAFQHTFATPPDSASEPLDPHWALNRCGFPEVWKCLEQGPEPGPIAMVDFGGDLDHDELDGVITEFPPLSGTPSKATHASEVAAVIAARRNGTGMDGCCSAKLHLYNVATTSGFDCKSFLFAMKCVADDPEVRVVNLSLESGRDPLIEQQVADCIAKGKILIAAMGDTGNSMPSYPAAYDDVIAVGATNFDDLKLTKSSTGRHILLSAPGEYIYTVSGAQGLDVRNHGPTYAAAMVSAAVWLALRAKPNLDRSGVVRLLSESVFKKGLPFEEVGHGRLDLRMMVRVLAQMGVPGMQACRGGVRRASRGSSHRDTEARRKAIGEG